MSFIYVDPYSFAGIVTSGLQLHLDAGNSASYPRSGTTWTDLSSTATNGILTDGPTYDSGNGGSIVFDGVNDRVIRSGGSGLSIPGTVTVSAWIRHTVVGNTVQRYITVGSEQASIRKKVNSSALEFFITTSGTTKPYSAGSVIVNTWYNVVGTWDGTTMRIYQNGALTGGGSTPGGTMATTTVGYTVSNLNETMNGRIAEVLVYNRALTATEIRKNFDALRGRFGR
jgi:hypothetical protein